MSIGDLAKSRFGKAAIGAAAMVGTGLQNPAYGQAGFQGEGLSPAQISQYIQSRQNAIEVKRRSIDLLVRAAAYRDGGHTEEQALQQGPNISPDLRQYWGAIVYDVYRGRSRNMTAAEMVSDMEQQISNDEQNAAQAADMLRNYEIDHRRQIRGSDLWNFVEYTAELRDRKVSEQDALDRLKGKFSFTTELGQTPAELTHQVYNQYKGFRPGPLANFAVKRGGLPTSGR
jgi:hypothetical protein